MTQVNSTLPPAVAKQMLISQHLRNVIIEGKLPPGGRLPTQVELVEKFRVSGVTIQRVMNRLSREGFIRTHGRGGTFVAPYPPHLCNYGVVFHHEHAPGMHRSRYHDVLEAQALRLQRSGERRVTIFNGISGHEDSKASSQLLNKVRTHQMAGLLLIDGDVFSGTPLVAEPGICRAAIMSCNALSVACPIIYPDIPSMIDLALDTLIARGRRRIATMITVPLHHNVSHYLRSAMQARGLAIQDRWMQIIPHNIPEPVRNNVMLMMTAGQERPDGVFIVDDNLVEGASWGFNAAGSKVGEDLDVVAHCNFPWTNSSIVPMHRVGFDTRKMMETAINLIDMQRQGRRAPTTTKVPAVREVVREKND